jgi:DNA adenine methylase
MLEAICKSESKILLSGYDNPLYQEYLKDWKMETKHTAVERGQSKTECLWMNFTA